MGVDTSLDCLALSVLLRFQALHRGPQVAILRDELFKSLHSDEHRLKEGLASVGLASVGLASVGLAWPLREDIRKLSEAPLIDGLPQALALVCVELAGVVHPDEQLIPGIKRDFELPVDFFDSSHERLANPDGIRTYLLCQLSVVKLSAHIVHVHMFLRGCIFVGETSMASSVLAERRRRRRDKGTMDSLSSQASAEPDALPEQTTW